MRVRVLYFGVLKETMRSDGEEVELAAGSSVMALVERIRDRGRDQDSMWRSIAIAVNREYVRAATVLQEGDEVALLPPVSGGAPGRTTEGGMDAR